MEVAGSFGTRQASRLWIHLIRWMYPRGLFRVLDRWGTRFAKRKTPTRIEKMSRPDDLGEAFSILAGDVNARVIGGGTDLLTLHEQGLIDVNHLVDTQAIGALTVLKESSEGDLEIGGGVTLADIVRLTDGVKDRVLHETVASIASQQIREMAVLAGNLCQANRCWFYRNDFLCYKRGGVTCPCYAVSGDNRFYHSVIGAHRCQAVTPSDLATTLAALDARVQVWGAAEAREIPVASLYEGPGETVLSRGEIIVSARISSASRKRTSHFEKICQFQGGFSIASSCVSLDLNLDGTIRDARIFLGAVAPVPYRAVKSEQLLQGQKLENGTVSRAASAWIADADPLKGNRWKVDAVRGLLARSLRYIAHDVGPNRTDKKESQ